MTAGHPGRDETIRKTKEIYQWPGVKFLWTLLLDMSDLGVARVLVEVVI